MYRDTEILGKMSPYATITFNGQKYKSKVHSNAGKLPVWGDEFQFEVTGTFEELTLRIWDQDLTSSDAVGFTKIKMSSLIINCGLDDWFTIMFDNKPAGEIRISTTFAPEGGDEFENMKQRYEEQ